MKSGLIQIVLPTYNAGPYLDEQLASILAQDDPNWQVLLHDDGSTDGITLETIERWSETYPERFVWMKEAPVAQGSSAHFAWMMARTEAEYVALCDQDDYWFPDKIRRSRAALDALTARSQGAALVFTDMEVVDAERKPISPSFSAAMKLDPQRILAKYARIVAQSTAAGCTMLMNRKAVEAALPMPGDLFQHDHWILIQVAGSDGSLEYLPWSSMQYRQHGGNAVGAHAVGMSYFGKKMAGLKRNWQQWTSPKTKMLPVWEAVWAKAEVNLRRLL